ncbi:ATP-binding protein [Paenibacillus alkalitolerans]|uniref:ATP-binding protein n=1 Tax=Paenibacillus alkalitolerans TaxID=2799335 RepID=UPI00389927D1
MLQAKQWTLLTKFEAFDKQIERFFRSSPLLIDRGGYIVRVQTELAAFLGYDVEELEGKHFSSIFLYPAAIAELTQSAAGPAFPSASLIDKYGTVHTSDYSVFLIGGDNGQGGSVVALHDLGGDSKMNLLQRFAGSFIRDINLGVILIDTNFLLVDISDMACRVLGFERDKVLGRPMEEVFASVPSEHRLVQRTILDGVVVKNHAVSWTNNQERHELLMDSNLLKDRAGRTVGAYVMFKDVSNLRSLEQQVQRSDRLAMIGQIAAGTAHEIRNPLTSIKGFLQVLKNTLKDNGMDKEYGYTELMLKEIDRINELVSEFLLLSKPRNATLTKVNVAEVIRDILPIINNEAILHGVTVEYQSSLDMPFVVADRELLKQVFINISKNGIEAMGAEGGVLTITEKMDGEGQRLNVFIQDSGPGIPAFLIDKIFDPFFTTKEQGTGLGLSVCQRIIHDIGGTIRVSSKGYGTIFIVSIPCTGS